MTLQRRLRFGFLALMAGLALVLPSAAQVGGSRVPQSLQAPPKLLRSTRKGNKHAPLVSDNFDFDDNGWTVDVIPGNGLSPVQFFPTGGAAGGYIGHDDLRLFFFVSSDHFVGERGAAYGGTLTFYMRGAVDEIDTHEVLVQIQSSIGIIGYRIANIPALPAWKQFTLSLTPEAGWTLRDQPISRQQMVCALQSFKLLTIGNFERGEGAIDEVHLNAPAEKAKGKIDSRTFDFGQVNVGSNAVKTFRVSCTSKTAALLTKFENVPEGFKIEPVGDYCGAIPPGGNQQFQITFSPARGGTYSGSASLIINGGAKFPLQLKGVAQGKTNAPNVAGFWSDFIGASFTIHEMNGNLSGDFTSLYDNIAATGTFTAAYTPGHPAAFEGTYNVPDLDHGQLFFYTDKLTENPPRLVIHRKSQANGLDFPMTLTYSGPLPPGGAGGK